MSIVVAVIDGIAVAAFLSAALLVFRCSQPLLPQDTRLLLTGMLGIYVLVSGSNLLEYTGVTHAPTLDRIEDYLQLLFPLAWLFFAITIVRESQHRQITLLRDEWQRSFEFVPHIVMLFDERGILVRKNAAAKRSLVSRGMEVGEASGLDVVGGVDTLAARADSPPCEVTSIDLEGTFVVTVRRTPATTGAAYVWSAQDVTALNQMKEELAEARKMDALGHLAAGLAHDFRNVLSGIVGYASLLLEDNRLLVGQRKALTAIRVSAEKGEELVKALLSVGSGESRPLKPVRISQVVTDVLAVIAESFPERIRVVPELEDEGLAVWGDELALFQLVLNLALNARDAMPAGGVLVIRTFAVAGDDTVSACLEVEDDGCGMDEEVMKRMYEPLYSTKPRDRGMGLGLATVYATVRRHEGVISCTSTPGLGTRFRVCFPTHTLPHEPPIPIRGPCDPDSSGIPPHTPLADISR